MKPLVICILLICAMALLGWLNFSRDNGAVSATLDTDKVRQDTAQAVEKGKELVEEGRQMLKESAENSAVESASGTKGADEDSSDSGGSQN